jgi:energy-coupling factor transporter ATP-binding protein EcfA2
VLRAIDLRFSHRGGQELFGGLTFEIPDGGFALICGANGAGKSTFLDILGGLESPRGGTVELDGESAREALAKGTALVPQDPDQYLLGEDPREELELGLSRSAGSGKPEDAVRGSVKGGAGSDSGTGESGAVAGAEAIAERWGLSGMLDVPVERLSHGLKKRLAIASALAGGPKAVLLDEPFSGLDWPGTGALLEDLARLKAAGRVCVVATHEPYLLSGLADAWLLLKREGSLFTRDPAVLKRLPEFGVRPYPGPCP